MSKYRNFLIGTALVALVASGPALAEGLGLGRPATEAEIDAWDVSVRPDGRGLPDGSMSVADGEMVFVDNCAACHGDFAEGLDNWPALAGGRGTLTDERPVKTVGSYWPYLSTVFDYGHRSMAFGNAQSLTPDETYGVVAYILYSEGLVDDDFVLSKDNFLDVRMPNEDGFYIDDRTELEFPLFSGPPCMEGCKDDVEVTRRASDLAVTPMDGAGRPVGTIPDWTVEAAVQEASTSDAPVEEAASGGPDPELVAAGERAFRQCSTCHEVGDGARNRTGPHLNDVFGRVAASIDGFRYSRQFMAAGEEGLVWTEETVHDFLMKPRDYIKGTRMSFNGFRNQEDIAAVIAYLQTYDE